jgi:hypothetical protein
MILSRGIVLSQLNMEGWNMKKRRLALLWTGLLPVVGISARSTDGPAATG